MLLGNRAPFVAIIGLSAVLAGCGGGGSGPSSPGTMTPSLTPTATPTATATPTRTAGPTPTPLVTSTPLPQTAATAVAARPLTAGDTFTYSGSLSDDFVYNGQSPNPNGTSGAGTPVPSGMVLYAVSQQVNDAGTKPFAGATPYDLHAVETDAQANQTITITTDTYLGDAPYAGATGLFAYGFSSTDSNGQAITQTSSGVAGASANGLLDIFPETGGQTWTNTGAATLAETDPGGFSANRTTNGDGTYAETDTYAQPSAYGQGSSATATLTENADGSGSYSLPLGGPPNATITYGAPAGGAIAITGSGGAFGGTETFAVPTWYALPLYVESDSDRGAHAFPPGCTVAAAFGTQGNAIEQRFTKVDTVLGTREYFDQITYVSGGYAVCTTLSDITQIFYDFTGQGNQTAAGVDFTGGNSPAEVETVSSTLGLGATSVTPQARRAALAATFARSAAARTNFLAVVERRRLARMTRAARHIASIRSQGFRR